MQLQISFLIAAGMLLCLTKTSALSLDGNTSRCIQKERMALQDMSPSCSKYYEYKTHDCCNWPGVYCSSHSGRIYGINSDEFLGNCLSWSYISLPDYLFHLRPSLLALEDLRYLSIDYQFNIPSFIFSFTKLTYLYLCGDVELSRLRNLIRLETLEVCPGMSINKFETFSSLTLLRRLVLRDAYFTDEVKDWVNVVSNLAHLEHLDLSGCYLPDVIPPNSGANVSKSLTFLDLSSNNLQCISSLSWLFNNTSQISSLSHLDLSDNQLRGAKLPISMKGLCSLRHLDLSGNQYLKGDIASIFRSLSCASNSLQFLSLRNNNFSGSIPDFTNFPSLRELDVSGNRLNGSLPSEFDKPSSLVILDSSDNNLTGSIPDLSVFRYLQELQIRNNKLNGTIHSGLGQLSKLRNLDISSNSLKGVLGISHFRNLSSLRDLDMSFNSLAFNVASSWVPPFRLSTIGVAFCRLGPRFPEWLRTQTNYLRLDMSNAGILDTIPSWFWNLSRKPNFISLSHNSLHGIIPPDFSFANFWTPNIDLSFNFLEGNIPSYFSKAFYLNLSRNSFSGSASILCQSLLSYGIDLSHNSLSGKLPDCFSNSAPVFVLDLSNNNFTGQLPRSLGNLTELRSLHLRENKFSGKLPLSLCNLMRLFSLDLGDNLFSGELPSCLGYRLNNLTVLSLRNNAISGRIPPQLCHPSVQILDLSLNNISGVIPECLCNMQAMTQKKSIPVALQVLNGTFSTMGAPYKDYISLVLKGYLYNDGNHLELVKSLDFSSNNLGGKIPDEISCLTGLISLNFSGNNLTGSITSKIGSLKSLESLDFYNNRLYGEIPSAIADLNFLGSMNLANNNLSGEIPTGTQIQGFNASAFAGNPGLCGDPLMNKCPGDGDVDGKKGAVNKNDQHLKDNNDSFDLGLYISVALGFIAGFWGISGVLVLNRSWRYAYFRLWNHAYDRLSVVVTVMVVRLQRRFLA